MLSTNNIEIPEKSRYQSMKDQEVVLSPVKQIIPVHFVIRGKTIQDKQIQFTNRTNDLLFTAPDVSKYINELVQHGKNTSIELFRNTTISDIIEFLVETGKMLDVDANPYLIEACRTTTEFSNLPPSIIKACYKQLPSFFTKRILERMIENEIGSKYLDGWVETPVPLGRAMVRAYGAKALHIIAGNVPLVAALSIIRGALTKSDNIIKLPSNDPLTATAILKTMIDVDRKHPVVKNFSAVYWKGGNTEFERRLVNPHNLEKIVAWGGYNSIKHIKTLVGPGIDLITLDPKFSVSIIGEEAFETDETIETTAFLAAIDSAAYNQEACVSSRTHFVKTTPENAVKYSRYLYKFMQEQDPSLSTLPKSFPSTLQEDIDCLRYMDGFYEVTGGENGEGAVITSLAGEPVEFFPSCKTVNVIPIDDYSEVLNRITIATQTVSVYPERLKDYLMDSLVTRGVQRFVSLGHATAGMIGVPHDAIEPMRRACKWIVNEIYR